MGGGARLAMVRRPRRASHGRVGDCPSRSAPGRLRLPYRGDAGSPRPSPGGLAITGTEAEIQTQLQRLASLGVSEFWPIIFPAGDDPATSRHKTETLLARLAAAS
jgi:hypothetical protein